MKEIVFTQSSSLGIRENRIKKNMLRREESIIETIYGALRVKHSFYNGKRVHSKPEFEDCKILAVQNKVSISEIERAVNTKLEIYES